MDINQLQINQRNNTNLNVNVVNASELVVKNSSNVKLFGLPKTAPPANKSLMSFDTDGSSVWAQTVVVPENILLNENATVMSAGQFIVSNGGENNTVPSDWILENGSGVVLGAGCQLTQLSGGSVSHLDTVVADSGNVNLTITAGIDKKFILSDALEVSEINNGGLNVLFSDGVSIKSDSNCESKLEFFSTASIKFKQSNATISDNIGGDLLFENAIGDYKFDKALNCETSLYINNGLANAELSFIGGVLNFNTANSYDFDSTVNIASFKAQTCAFGNSRPMSVVTGQSFFDTNLIVPRPIWWNGSNWIDAMGTPV